YAAYNNQGVTEGEFYRSTDGGQTYTRRNTGDTSNWLGSQGWYDNIIWVDPTNADTVVVGGIDLWRSTDGGQTFQKISIWEQNRNSVHADHHYIVHDPGFNGTANRRVYLGNDGGVYKTDNIYTAVGTSGFQPLLNKLGITQFYGAAGNETANIFWGGAQDNGTLHFTGTDSWGEAVGGDGGFCAADPVESAYLYGEYTYLQMYRSTNFGASASDIYNASGNTIADANQNNALFIAPFLLDPNNANTMYGGAERLWRSTNVKAGTPDWFSVKAVVAGNPKISAIAVSPGDPRVIWVGYDAGGRVEYSSDTGATWVQVGNGTLPSRYVQRIVIDPNRPSRVHVTFGGYAMGNIWRTEDTGATWYDVNTNATVKIPSVPVRGFAVWARNSDSIYAGTDIGVYASTDSGKNWSPTNDGPSNVSVDELFWQRTDTLYAATHGRGLWRINVARVVPPSDTAALGPNKWYVNDASTTGDSFTSAAGSNGNNGLTIATPKLTLSAVIPFLSEGDTVYIDAGTFTPSDTVRIETNAVWILGKDSISTVIDFNDSSQSGQKSIYASGRNRITIRDLAVTRAYHGLWFNNADTCVIERVRTDSHSQGGMNFENGSDSNLVVHSQATATGNGGFRFVTGSGYNTLAANVAAFTTGNGFHLNASTGNTLINNTFWGNDVTNDGFNLSDTSNNNTLLNNRSETGLYGFLINRSAGNLLSGNIAIATMGEGFEVLNASHNNVLTNNVASLSLTPGFEVFANSNGNTFLNNRSTNGRSHGFRVFSSSNNVFRQNMADSNLGWGFYIDGDCSADTFQKNVYIPSPALPDSALFESTFARMNVERNWWGSTDSAAIKAKFAAFARDSAVYIPYRLGIVDTTAGADTVAPRAPDTVAAAVLSSSAIRVSWSPVTVNEEASPFAVSLAQYRIHRALSADSGSWPQVGVAGASAVSFDDTSLAAGVTYYYRVTAVDSATPFENQSFFSDSTGSAMTPPDTSGPNAWYVNDTSTTGDSFTSSVGDDANSGLFISTPKRSLAAIDHLLTAGDTVYVDSGFYYEVETVTVGVSGVLIRGVDSSSSIIRFDSNSVQACRAVQVLNATGVTIRDIAVLNASKGIWLNNGDQGSIQRVKLSSNGRGIHLLNADTNSITDAFASSSGTIGFYLVTSHGNTMTACATSFSTSSGIQMDTCFANSVSGCTLVSDLEEALIVRWGGRVTITGNIVSGSAYAITLENSSNNVVERNIAVSNQDGIWLDTATNNIVRGNLSASNTRSGITLRGASTDNFVSQNQLSNNGWYQISIIDAGAADTFLANNILVSTGNPDSGVFLGSRNRMKFARNWWGSVDSVAIRADLAGLGRDSIDYSPFRLTIADTNVGADSVAPEAPAGLTVDSPYAQIRISWAAVAGNEDGLAGAPGVVKYLVYRSRRSDTSVWGAPVGETTATSFSDTSTAPDTDYFYRITAQDGASLPNQSFYSSIVSGRSIRATGDFTGDSTVTLADFRLIQVRFKTPGLYDPLFDIGRNGVDGVINEEDFLELARRYGQ
ncbi:MAG: NosD domain-containing protein, partial [Candidatus Hydrogenedentota bacterium]